MRSRLVFTCVILSGLLVFLVPPAGRDPSGNVLAAQGAKPALTLVDNRSSDARDVVVETAEWRIAFGLRYNGGVYRLYDKVNDPGMKDNLVTDRNYCQGGLFDHDVYLMGPRGPQEFMSTLGPNREPGRAKIDILENTAARVRLRQFCRPRLNNGDGPPDDPYIECPMVEETTDWTIYATGRVAIAFNAAAAGDWDGVVSRGPGGAGPGISIDGYTVTAVGGADFMAPWVTAGDSIESRSGGWGPLVIAVCPGSSSLKLAERLRDRPVPPPPRGEKLDFIVRRPYPVGETISIHADGGTNKKPREQCWLGGSNGVPEFNRGKMGDIRRPEHPPVQDDYVFAHWTVAPRGFGSLLAFNEPNNAEFAVVNDFGYQDISYTQYVRGTGDGYFFMPVQRHFLAQIGIDRAAFTPAVKGIPDALPFADDYRNPWAEARAGALDEGEGILQYGFHAPTGAYRVTAAKKTAAVAFDASRGRQGERPVAYRTPAVLVSGLDVPDNGLAVELSRDNGKTFKPLPGNSCNVTTRAEASQLGGRDRRLIQLLVDVPVDATGSRAWVVRLRAR